jgi:hypothetical protein
MIKEGSTGVPVDPSFMVELVWGERDLNPQDVSIGGF